VQIGLVFRPRRSLLPGKIIFHALRLGLIASPVALLQVQDMQGLQVFSKGLTNERGSIHLLPLRCSIRRFQQGLVQNNLYGFHCGFLNNILKSSGLRSAR
jgi:hypothetical protein